ncbi:hypothetical protein FQV39_16275 [Bosea sp. F3-2]|uniref:hypothetical protein n=1 Tax=Bosea sp. F3-2 TaxID=2599640 RepID=UPI0011EDA793|nr:hypothetical protein [Bosea sp. F3-2]QEL23958.1 hypothetical protein FQV39_16275 [Bosea sp. F3-2]
MTWRNTVILWWRRTEQFYSDLPDITRHEGLVTATTVLGYRLGRMIKHRLLSSIHSRRAPYRERHVVPATIIEENAPLKPGVLFVGYIEAGLGLGVSLRGLINSTAETDVPFAVFLST